mmetsp:Transcript_14361/g.28685  ORF Transcript_14361/g.28685 Transcript_14361/m.28685 type:complete len:85 (-) Transcript_14361:117-371(-)
MMTKKHETVATLAVTKKNAMLRGAVGDNTKQNYYRMEMEISCLCAFTDQRNSCAIVLMIFEIVRPNHKIDYVVVNIRQLYILME